MSLPVVECPYEVPNPYRWNDSFKVFYQNLDDEHKGLFDGCFDMDADRTSAANISSLQEKVITHFANEEVDMQTAVTKGDLAADYLTAHKAKHAAFVAILNTVQPTVTDEVINYAFKWLVNHIKATDFQYKDCLQK